MTRISVIMPVFNDELYLKESIESVMNQSLKDIELICVNDGSSDNSLEILNNLKEKYTNLKVISQENQGVAVARNNAMGIAEGDYFAFLDSDDIFMSEDVLEKLYDVAINNNADMVSGNLFIWDGEDKLKPITFLKYYDTEEIILPENYGVPFSFTKAIFKKEFLFENKIDFPLLTKGEDPVFLAHVLSKLDCIYAVPVDVYAYRYIDGSVKYGSYKNYRDQVLHYKMVFDYLSDSKFDKTRHEFKYQLMGLFDFMSEEQAETTLKAVREIFADDAKTLRQCEEYFYFKYKNNEKLSDLVEFKKNPSKPRISVIVPIYNNENTLNYLKYVLNQSLDDFEVLCINDGSTDDSLEIINEFASDERVRIINQEHKGYAESKNRGLMESKGEYIYFYEPGTFLSKKYLEILYRNAMVNDSDITLSKYYSSDNLYLDINNFDFDLTNKIKGINLHKHVFDYGEFPLFVLNAPFSSDNKLYKKEFLDKHDDLKFTLDLAFDDVIFHIKSMLKANKISFAKNIKINYKFKITHNYFNSLISKNMLDIIGLVEDLLKENNCYSKLLNEFKLFKFINIVNNMIFVNDEEDFQLLKKEVYDLNFDEYNIVNQDMLERYINIVKSNNLNDFKFNENTRRNHKLTHDYQSIKGANKKLIKDNKKLKNKINKSKKLNKEILSSNSLKVTKSMRKFRRFF